MYGDLALAGCVSGTSGTGGQNKGEAGAEAAAADEAGAGWSPKDSSYDMPGTVRDYP